MKEVKIGGNDSESDESAFKQIFLARARPRRATSSPSRRGDGAPPGLRSRAAGAQTIL